MNGSVNKNSEIGKGKMLRMGWEEDNDELVLGRLSLMCLWNIQMVLSRRRGRCLDPEARKEVSLTLVQKSSQPFQQIVLEQLEIRIQEIHLNLYFTLYTKVN